MREKYYQLRLKSDLKKWIEQGRISQQSADNILRDLPSSNLSERLPRIIAIKGAILICFGILAFVATDSDSGEAGIKALLVRGQPVYEEPFF
jgi:uncharacterized membrane protein